jgi:hypothetical protein
MPHEFKSKNNRNFRAPDLIIGFMAVGVLAASPDISTWQFSEERFVARIRARAVQLGKPLGVLLTEAGLAQDALTRSVKHGRRIDTFERLARACRWSLAEAMGFEEPEILEELMIIALRITRRGLREIPLNDQLWGGTIARVYRILTEMRRAGQPIDDRAEAMLVASIREFVAGRQLP